MSIFNNEKHREGIMLAERSRIRFIMDRHADAPEAGIALISRNLGIYQTVLKQGNIEARRRKNGDHGVIVVRHFSRSKEYFAEYVGSCMAMQAFLKSYAATAATVKAANN